MTTKAENLYLAVAMMILTIAGAAGVGHLAGSAAGKHRASESLAQYRKTNSETQAKLAAAIKSNSDAIAAINARLEIDPGEVKATVIEQSSAVLTELRALRASVANQ